MNDRPIDLASGEGDPDPAVVDALRSLTPPPHRFGFWAEVEDGIGSQAAPTEVVPVVPLAPAPPLPPGPVPPLAEVTPLPPPRGGGLPRWLAVAAAALVLVAGLGAALLARNSRGTDIETTSPSSTLPVETTAASTTLPAPTTTAPMVTVPVTTPKPTVASTTTPPTTARSSLVATHDALGPLRIGMTTKQATATGAMAAPTDPLDTGGQCTYADPAGSTYRADDFGAILLNGRLARLYFGSGSRVRTPEGIGSGSAASKLQSIAGTRTESPHPYGGGTNIDITRGDVGYQFTVDGGKVTEWSIGTKEGLGLPEGCA
jgi:hypothetical protein